MKVLMVDNEAAILELVEIALDDEDDIELETTDNGADGIRRLSSNAYDVFVFDLMMPPPDGRALLQAVRADPVNRAKPVIICTAKTDSENTESLKAEGATMVLTKPFRPIALADQLREIVAKSRT